MSILQTYRERRFGSVSRDFELFEDRIHVFGNNRGTRFDTTILLDDLTGNSDQLWVRSPYLNKAVFAAFFCIFLIVMLLRPDAPPELWSVPAILLALISVFLLFVSRRIEYWQFKNHTGVVLFDVGKIGPDSAKFPEFMVAIKTAVERRALRTQTHV